jgi:hypothetical protein
LQVLQILQHTNDEKIFHPNYTLSLYRLSDSAVPILYTLHWENIYISF